MAWKVHSNPIILVGGFRALIIQALHPLAMAGVLYFSDFREDPLRRLRRTARYVHTVIFEDTASVDKMSATVRAIHDRVSGVDPVTGRTYEASDPDTLLWVHCVEAHSFIYAYRRYVGELPLEEQDRYFAEYVKAGELVGIPREMIPASRDEYREYFASMRPELLGSDLAKETVQFIARPLLRRVPVKTWPFAVNLKFAGHAAVGLVPRDLRELAGLPDPGAREWALTQATRANARGLDLAMRVGPVARQFERIAEQNLGTKPLPADVRG